MLRKHSLSIMDCNQIYSCVFEFKDRKSNGHKCKEQLEMLFNTKWKLEVNSHEFKVVFMGSDIQEFRADFEISLNDKVWRSVSYFRSDENASNWVSLRFPPLSSDKTQQKLSVRVTVIRDCLASNAHQLRDGFISDFKTQFEDNSTTDFTICVKDREFSVHSQILSARSPVFRAMLSHDMIEKKERKTTAHEFDPKTFEALLKFLYFCEVSEIDSMTDQEKECLLKAADFYDIKDLKQLVASKMFETLTVENVKKALLFADNNEITSLETRCYQFIAENRMSLISSSNTSISGVKRRRI